MSKYRGFGSKFYSICLVLVPLWCSFSSLAHAQSTPTYESTAKSSVNTGTSSGKSKTSVKQATSNAPKRKTNQSVAQGLTLAESMMLNQTSWGFFLSTSASRGLDEYEDEIGSSTSLDMSYSLDSSSALGLSVGYDGLLYSYDGDLFNNKSSEPDRFGISDTELSYSRPKIWSDKYNTLAWSTTLSFPTSKVSQRSSLIIDASTRLALRYRPIKGLIITPSVSFYGRQYRYDTADVAGYDVNSPFGFTYGLASSYIVNSWLTGAISYGQTQRYDYLEDWRTIQSLSASLNITATDTMNIYAGYRWRDTLITNEALFDDDRSLIFTGVTYAF